MLVCPPGLHRSCTATLLLIVIALLAGGCNLAFTPTPTITPTVTLTPSATPDVYATSAARTLAAIAGSGTESYETLVALAATGTAARTITPSATPPPPTNTPLPTFTPTPTVTLTPILTPTPELPPTPVHFQLIRYFTASPTEVAAGGSFLLMWSAVGERATLYTVTTGQLSDMVDNLPLTGTRVVTLDPAARNSVSYALYVTQGTRTENAVVTVTIGCPDTWFFPDAATITSNACPQSPPVRTAAAAERFERGMMIWLGTPLSRIYVLYSDGGVTGYSVFNDPWQPGLPESDPSIVPPAGLFQPVRGFGMVWRGEQPSNAVVRERLGWAVEPEYGYEALFQCDSAIRYITCYLRGPSGELIILRPEGSGWTVWQGTP